MLQCVSLSTLRESLFPLYIIHCNNLKSGDLEIWENQITTCKGEVCPSFTKGVSDCIQITTCKGECVLGWEHPSFTEGVSVVSNYSL